MQRFNLDIGGIKFRLLSPIIYLWGGAGIYNASRALHFSSFAVRRISSLGTLHYRHQSSFTAASAVRVSQRRSSFPARYWPVNPVADWLKTQFGELRRDFSLIACAATVNAAPHRGFIRNGRAARIANAGALFLHAVFSCYYLIYM